MTLVRAAPCVTLAVVMLLTATAAGAAASALRSVTVAGSVVVRYPTDWAAQLMGDGTVVALAGPNAGGTRPAITIMVSRGQGQVDAMMDSAARGLGQQAPVRLLGEQRLQSDRRARYYQRGGGAATEYVVVGIAQRDGWVATMVAIDAASDPALPVRARLFQDVLLNIAFPVPH